jgi:glutamyl/glutaminyl-tRNA synthetase
MKATTGRINRAQRQASTELCQRCKDTKLERRVSEESVMKKVAEIQEHFLRTAPVEKLLEQAEWHFERASLLRALAARRDNEHEPQME